MEPETVLTVVGSFVGGSGITAVTNYLSTKAKTNGEQKLAEASQPVQQLSAIVQTVMARIEQVEAKNNKLSDDHVKCLEMHADTRQELGKLQGQLLEQRASVDHLRTVTTEQNIQAIKVAADVAAQAVKTAAMSTGQSDSGVLSGVDKQHPLPVEIMEPTKDAR